MLDIEQQQVLATSVPAFISPTAILHRVALFIVLQDTITAGFISDEYKIMKKVLIKIYVHPHRLPIHLEGSTPNAGPPRIGPMFGDEFDAPSFEILFDADDPRVNVCSCIQ